MFTRAEPSAGRVTASTIVFGTPEDEAVTRPVRYRYSVSEYDPAGLLLNITDTDDRPGAVRFAKQFSRDPGISQITIRDSTTGVIHPYRDGQLGEPQFAPTAETDARLEPPPFPSPGNR